jgi:hypothetical protein
MQMLFLFNVDNRPFVVDSIRNIFESVSGFKDMRRDGLVGSVIEADYVEGQDWTIVRLNDKLTAISLSGSTDAAFHAALIVQTHYPEPLRITDMDYSFDLILKGFTSIDKLRSAISDAQAN